MPVATSQAVIENLLQWRTNEQSVSAAVQANLRVEASSKAAAGALGGLASVGGSEFELPIEYMKQLGLVTDITAQNVDALTGDTARLASAARTAAQEEERLAASTARAARAGGGQGLKTGFGTLRSAGAAFSNLGGGTGITQVASLVGLGSTLGVVGVAAGALALGLRTVTAEIDRATQAMSARLDVERSVAREVVELTTQQAQEKIRAAEVQLAVDRDVARQQAANSALYTLSFVNQPLALGRALAGLDPVYNAYQEALAKNQVAIEGDQASIEAYNKALENGTTAAGNAAAAEQELADIRKQLLDTRAEREVNQANAELAAQRLTSDERQKRIAELGEEIPIQRALTNTVGISVEAWAILNAQLLDMEAEYFALIAVTDSYTDRMARADQYTQALVDQSSNYLDALTREIEAREDVFAAQQELDALGAENIARLQALYADRNERLLEAETEAGERRAEIAEDSADRIARITRDAGREQVNAIANRDSLANTLSQQQEADALADQKKADTKQAERLTRQLDKLEDTIQKSHNKQALQTAQAYDAEVSIKRRGLQQAQVDLTNAVFNEQRIASYGSGELRSIQIRHWTEMELITNNFALRIVRNVQDIFGSLFFGRSAGASSSAYQIGYQAARDYVYTLNTGGRTIPS